MTDQQKDEINAQLLAALKRIVADYKCYVLDDDAEESVRLGEEAIAHAEGRPYSRQVQPTVIAEDSFEGDF